MRALSFVFLLMASSVFAAPQTIEDISIPESMSFTQSGKKLTLPLLGAGLRVKKIAFLKFKVYVASLYATSPKDWESSTAPLAVKIDFLRNLPGKRVVETFADSLERNSVDLESPAIKELLTVIRDNGDIKDRQSLIVTGVPGEKDLLTLTLSSGETRLIEGKPGLVRAFFSTWYGKLADSGMEKLMDQVLGKEAK